jgi:DNA replication protein DnaC
MRSLNGAEFLILDDWGLDPLDAGARRDLYEILEERYGRRSTILTSQIPVDKWHQVIGDPTYADAILDRLVHNVHRIQSPTTAGTNPTQTSREGLTSSRSPLIAQNQPPAGRLKAGDIISEQRAT